MTVDLESRELYSALFGPPTRIVSTIHSNHINRVREEYHAVKEVLTYSLKNWNKIALDGEDRSLLAVSKERIVLANQMMSITYFVRLFATFGSTLENHLTDKFRS